MNRDDYSFIERLSCIFGKQYLFKQSNNNYYNRYTCGYMTKEEAQDWLYSMFLESENALGENLWEGEHEEI